LTFAKKGKWYQEINVPVSDTMHFNR